MNPSGGGDDDPRNTCTRSVQPSDWTGQTDSSSVQSDGGDDYYEDYESSDGRITATLDVTDYVGSGETLQSVAVDYGGNADCDSQADFCTADASTQVSFNTGESESGAAATDSNTANDSYSGTLTTTNENVQTIEATNDSSANTARTSNGPDVQANASAAVGGTEITVECSDSDGGGDDQIKPPIASDDEASIDLCSAEGIILDVPENDSDPDSDNSSIDSVGNPSRDNGTTKSLMTMDLIKFPTRHRPGQERQSFATPYLTAMAVQVRRELMSTLTVRPAVARALLLLRLRMKTVIP
jgi:hypothetical protein